MSAQVISNRLRALAAVGVVLAGCSVALLVEPSADAGRAVTGSGLGVPSVQSSPGSSGTTDAGSPPFATGILISTGQSLGVGENSTVCYDSVQPYHNLQIFDQAWGWQASHVYPANSWSNPTNGYPEFDAGNGRIYLTQDASCTAGSTAPVWPTTIGNTVTDNTCVWTCKYASRGWWDITAPGSPSITTTPLTCPDRSGHAYTAEFGPGKYPYNFAPYPTGEALDVAASNAITFAGHDAGMAREYTVLASMDGESGQPMSDIQKGGTGLAYQAGLTETQEAVNLLGAAPAAGVIAVLLTHGQADASSCDPIATYAASLVTLQSNYQTDVSAITGQTSTVPMLAVQNNQSPAAGNGGACGVTNWTSLALTSAALTAPGLVVEIGPIYPFERYAVGGFNGALHLNDYRELGEKYEEVYAWISGIGHAARAWVPLMPTGGSYAAATGWTFSGTSTTITFNVPVGSLVLDTSIPSEFPHQSGQKYGDNGSVFGAGNPGWTSGYGVECWNGSTPVAVSSISVISATQLAVTCLSTSTTIHYAHTMSESTGGDYGGGWLGGLGRAGMLRDQDTFVGPVTGVAQQNWCIEF